MKTVKEVLTETGLSYPQLNQLRGLGILAKPARKSQGYGKGVIGVYDDEVIDIIRWVKKQQREGLTLFEISEKWRGLKANEKVAGELSVEPPNPDVVHWATDIFASLAEEYPTHAYGKGEIESVEELPDGKLRVQFLLSKEK